MLLFSNISLAADEDVLNPNFCATFLEVIPFEVTTVSRDASDAFT